MITKKKKDIKELTLRCLAGEISLKEILEYGEDELYAIAHVGYFFLMQGKYEEAKSLFDGLIALDPKNDYYYRALGVVLHKMGEVEDAIDQFGYAIRINPSSPHAYINRAEIYLSLKQKTQAHNDLLKSLELIDKVDQKLTIKAKALLKVVSS